MRRPGPTGSAPRRAALAAVLAVPLLVVAACGGSTPPPPTVKVDRGEVTSGVSASGTLVSVKQQNLGFADRGQVAELMVKVGDVVQAGQPLARLDDAAAKSTLASAQAKLDQQNASLGKTAGGNTVETAQADLDSSNEILTATRSNVDAVNAADGNATERARVQLDYDEKQLDKAERQKSCPTTTSPAAAPSLMGGSSKTQSSSGDAAASGSGATSGSSDQCATAYQQAKAAAIQSKTAYDAAVHKQSVDATQGDISIAQAKKSVADAQNQLNGARNDKPFDTQSADAVVRDAQNAVKDAQRGVDNTVLKAPIGGTVSAINGAVGDFIAAQGAATDLAPGSDARIPPAQGSATGDAGAAAGGATGSGSFITLNNVDGFQLIVPFEESDAAKLAPNQVVDVSVDAIPGVSKPGTVTAVAPSAQQVSGVNSYYTTIVVNETDPRMRDGQTAQAQVTTQKVDNVLRVPTAAIKTDGGSATASVPGPDGKPIETRFTPGLAGDAFTEVKDGLREGQDILLPQATVTATQGGGGPRGGG